MIIYNTHGASARAAAPVTPLGLRFEFDGLNGTSIHFGLERPTPREVHGFRRGPMRIGLLQAGLHTLFFLVWQPESLVSWADCPYAFGKVGPSGRFLPDRCAEGCELSYAITMPITDEHGGGHGVRMVSPTLKFCSVLDAMLNDQLRHVGDFSVAAHDREVAEAYRRWPTPDAMARAAAITEFTGKPR